ncbi:MAG: hypothetical protein GY702_10220 [Desulfobulbaceae bacterium]|nr:hypothetical protein [Desulfobulbaceae bacterium]
MGISRGHQIPTGMALFSLYPQNRTFRRAICFLFDGVYDGIKGQPNNKHKDDSSLMLIMEDNVSAKGEVYQGYTMVRA